MEASSVLALAAVLVATGMVTGLLAGLFGIGGGSILVPVLYAAFGVMGVPEDIRMHLTLGTSMAVIAPTGLRSFLAQRARGAANIDVIRRLALPVLAGVIVGIIVADAASSEALRWVWVVVGSAVAIKLLAGADDWRLADALPTSSAPIAIAAFFIGLLSALMSIGGGIFLVSLFTLHGMPLLQAIATSSGFGPLIAVAGLLGYAWAGHDAAGLPLYSFGYVNLLAAVAIIPSSMIAAPFGVRIAHALPKRHLEIAFGSFLLMVVANFLWTLLT